MNQTETSFEAFFGRGFGFGVMVPILNCRQTQTAVDGGAGTELSPNPKPAVGGGAGTELSPNPKPAVGGGAGTELSRPHEGSKNHLFHFFSFLRPRLYPIIFQKIV